MTKKSRLLIVDDEEKMHTLIATFFPAEKYDLLTAKNGDQAIHLVTEEQVDVMVLDLMMPGIDGFEVCRYIRQFSTIPVIFLTARGDEEDRIHGLRIGADDYMVKPFSGRELLARVEAQLRRVAQYQPTTSSTIHQFPSLEIDELARVVKVDEQVVSLTRKELDILLVLIHHPKQVFSREQLLDHVWGIDQVGNTNRTVDTHVKTLRYKLRGASTYIQTVWGVGYKFEVER